MVLAEIATSLAGIKTALDILKGLKKANTSGPILGEISDLQSALIEVQQGIMAANETHAADVERVHDLEKEVARLKAWNGEKQRYELKNVGAGAMVYSQKEGMEPREAPHWLCTNCYNNGKKSFLNPGGIGPVSHLRTWTCVRCSGTLMAAPGIAPQ